MGVSATAVDRAAMEAAIPERVRLRRLRHYYRSAGWPVRDAVELDLLVAGLVELRCAVSGHESVYVTASGLDALALEHARNRRRLDAHEALIEQVRAHLDGQGRLNLTGTQFKVKPGEQWRTVRPDLFSISRSLDERHVQPRVFEIKVSRADLRGDLRNPEKRAGYLQVCCQLTYVFPEGIARVDEVPAECGVWVVDAAGLLVERRAAPLQPNPLRPMHWLQLVAGLAGRPLADEGQLLL